MKKFVAGLIIGALLMLSVCGYAESLFQFKQSENTLFVDGTKVELPLYNYEYTNYASIRGVAEALGLDITVVDKRIDFKSKKVSQPQPILKEVVKNKVIFGQMARFLVRSLELKDTGKRIKFKDIDSGHEYYDDICVAISNGVLYQGCAVNEEGYLQSPTGTIYYELRPDSIITRGQYIYCLFQNLTLDIDKYADKPFNFVDDYKYEGYLGIPNDFIKACIDLGLLELLEDNKLDLGALLEMDLTPNKTLKDYYNK